MCCKLFFTEMFNLNTVIAEAAALLSSAASQKKIQIDSPRLEADLIASHVLSVQRLDLYSGKAPDFSSNQKDLFFSLIRQRSEGRPLAYITGKKWFLNHEFLVNESVLIPRPETEILTEHALGLLREFRVTELRVLDLCCGSGCIGLSVAAAEPRSSVILSDISEPALNTARLNAAHLNIDPSRLQFIMSDLFQKIPESERFHAILSNPPYIGEDEEDRLYTDVTGYEPRSALFHPDIPVFYRNIFEKSSFFLEEQGFMIVETSPRWIDLLKVTADNYFRETAVLRDLSGNPRHLILRYKKDG